MKRASTWYSTGQLLRLGLPPSPSPPALEDKQTNRGHLLLGQVKSWVTHATYDKAGTNRTLWKVGLMLIDILWFLYIVEMKHNIYKALQFWINRKFWANYSSMILVSVILAYPISHDTNILLLLHLIRAKNGYSFQCTYSWKFKNNV